MPSSFTPPVRTWIERVSLIGLTSLFHHYPMPTFVGIAIMIVVGIAAQKVPAEYRHWK
jgi:hypothetical protein